MKDRDYLWCLVHEILDREEELDRLCPECRSKAEEACCPACGVPVGEWGEGAVNTSFDLARFEGRKEGGA